MDFLSQLVPALVILAANLLSGSHASLRWSYVTAIFGWATGISLAAFLVLHISLPGNPVSPYLGQLCVFCLLTVLSREYERILMPLFPWNR